MATDHGNIDNPDDDMEFAISMAARLRTAARAADELGVSCRELARRFADQVDADLASDADPSRWRSHQTACKYCPGLLIWARDEAGKPLPLDPRSFPALIIAANQRWLPDRNVPGDNRPPGCVVCTTKPRASRIGGTTPRGANIWAPPSGIAPQRTEFRHATDEPVAHAPTHTHAFPHPNAAQHADRI
jgi:hypothetical protein